MKTYASLALAVFLLGLNACEQTREVEAASCDVEIALDAAGEPTVRVFAIGVKQDPSAMRTYADFSRLFFEAVKKEAPCFRKDIPTLLVFPENSALMAAFIGTRGESARERDDSVGAFADFFQSYQEPVAYYRAEYPGTPGFRALLVGMTDTLARAMEQTFPVIAERYGVYVAVSADVAPYEATSDPNLVAKLADPDVAAPSKAFVATAAEVYNYAIVYGPDGKELGRVAKAYLVPDEESLLQLNYGSLEQMRPIETPFGKLAPVISKDGWMPDVLERYNELGAVITLQHEAFSGWAVRQYEGDWLPDVVKQSLWNHVNAYDSFRYGVMPCITGNFLDLVFDCESAIVKEAAATDVPMRFIGQPLDKGFLDVGDWAMPDPVEENPGLSVEERRAMLRERGEALLPGSGSEHENAYAQSVARGGLYLPGAALEVTRAAVTGATIEDGGFHALCDPVPCDNVRHHRLAGNGVNENAIRPDIAFDGADHHIVYLHEYDGKRTARYVRVSAPNEVSFTEPVVLPFGAKEPHKVAVTASTNTVYAMISADLGDGFSTRIGLARSLDGGDDWSALPATFNERGPSAKYFPAMAAAGDRLYVTWTDRDSGSSDIMLAISDDRGDSFRTIRLDEPHADSGVADNPANTRNNQALPSIAANGDKVVVTWADFRDYSWDIYGAASTDGGTTWSANFRLNPQARTLPDETEVERIFGPNSVSLRNGRLLVTADGVDDREPYRTVRVFVATPLCDYLGVSCVSGFSGSSKPAFKPNADINAGGLAVIVAHGVGESDGDVFVAYFDGTDWKNGGFTKLPGQQLNVKVAEGLVVWEDWRSGRGQIGFSHIASF